MHHMLSVESTDHCLREIELYETSRQEEGGLFTTSESVSQMVEITRNKALKRSVTQLMADCNSTRKHRAKYKSFQYLEYDCLVSPYSTKSEEGLSRKEVQVEVARSKLLTTYVQNDVPRFSW